MIRYYNLKPKINGEIGAVLRAEYPCLEELTSGEVVPVGIRRGTNYYERRNGMGPTVLLSLDPQNCLRTDNPKMVLNEISNQETAKGLVKKANSISV